MPDNTPHYLIVSYHFLPSKAVGARRPTALKSFLEANGAQVSLIRGVESVVEEAEDARSDLQVAFAKKRLSAVWLALKARRQGGHRATAASTTDQASQTQHKIAWIRDVVRAWNGFLQGEKLWLFKVVWKLRSLPKETRYTAVIASGPPQAGYIAGAMAARRFNVPLILDFRDPWFLQRLAMHGKHPAFAYLGRHEDRLAQMCIDRASLLFVTSPGTAEYMKRSYAIGKRPVITVRNGYDEESVIDSEAPVGKLEMIFAGTIYHKRDPFPFLEALNEMLKSSTVDRGKVRFRLVGNCESWNGIPLAAWIDDKGLADVVSVDGIVTHAEVSKLTEAANVLVNFSQGQPLQIPAKSYEYLASNRDVVCIAESESDVARLHREARYGYIIEPNDMEAMRACLDRLYRKYVLNIPGIGDALPDTSAYSRRAQFGEFLSALEVMSDGETRAR